jgi:hypothetical protein
MLLTIYFILFSDFLKKFMFLYQNKLKCPCCKNTRYIYKMRGFRSVEGATSPNSHHFFIINFVYSNTLLERKHF